MKEQTHISRIDNYSRTMTLLMGGLLILAVISCAQLGIPSGGPEDTQEPQLIVTNSSPNYQTYFNEKQIVLEFDEWIVIQNAIQEVVVSPPLSYPFKFEAKGKKTIFSFSDNEVLKPDATYPVSYTHLTLPTILLV